MSDMSMSDLLGLFLEESEEQLQKLDDGVLHLEKDPNNAEVLQEVFRAAHTLKGSSATMGLTEIADLTHAMENLLDSLRSGSVTVTPEIVDLLLGSIDALRTLIAQVSHEEPMDLDTSELRRGLQSVCQTTGADAAPQAPTTQQVEHTDEGDSEHLTLTLKITDDCTMPSVRAFMVFNALSGLGEVASANPSQDDLDDVKAGQEIKIIFLPAQEADSVLNALRSLSEVELVEHRLPESPSATSAEKASGTANRTERGGEPSSKGIQTVRVGVNRLDKLMNLVAELVIDRTRVSQLLGELVAKHEHEDEELFH